MVKNILGKEKSQVKWQDLEKDMESMRKLHMLFCVEFRGVGAEKDGKTGGQSSDWVSFYRDS